MAVRKNTGQAVTEGINSAIALEAKRPENSAVFHKGLFEPAALEPAEESHYRLLMTNHFNQIEGGHAAFNSGLLPIPLTARGNGLLETDRDRRSRRKSGICGSRQSDHC